MKIKRGVYASAEDEIRNAFKDRPIETIRINNDKILLDGDMVVIKLRLPDRKHKLAKKDGYRLMYMVSKMVPVVVFLDIYPKNGPSQQLDEDDREVTRLIELFIDEAEHGSLEDFVL